MREWEFNPWVRKILWRRKWQPTPIFLPEESHGQRSLAGTWGYKESDMTENDLAHTHIRLGPTLVIFSEPDTLECKVKWALGSITASKASGGDGIPVELFHILKHGAGKVLHSVCQQIWKTQQWPQDWKWSVFIPIPKKGNAKEFSNYLTIALISHNSKVMLKILQARLQPYVNCKLPDV